MTPVPEIKFLLFSHSSNFCTSKWGDLIERTDPTLFGSSLVGVVLESIEDCSISFTRECDTKALIGIANTAHFEYISDATAHGLQHVALETGVPIGFGILTTYNEEQALVRSRPNVENKGREAAAAVVKSAKTLKDLI